MKTSKIEKVTSHFDNVLRIHSPDLELDVYQFDERDNFKVGDTIRYQIGETKGSEGTVLNGKVIGVYSGNTQVSFGGLIGAFKNLENFKEADNFSIWFVKA